MAQDSFTETTTRSYGSRLGNSLFGILFGLGLLVASVVLIWWNEGRTVARADLLEAGLESTVILNAPQYDAAHDGMLVYMNGMLQGGSLLDPQFGVRSEGIMLQRHVEMFQWKESVHETKTKELGGSEKIEKTYSYDTGWSANPINASKFKRPEGHANPPFDYNDQRYNATTTIGDFTLTTGLVNLANGTQPFSPQSIETKTGATLQGSAIYLGSDSANPKVGDMRITYSTIPNGQYSIVALQTSEKMLTFQTLPDNDTLAFVKSGTLTAQQIFESAQSENRLIAWGLRLLGLFLMFIGFTLIMGPIATLASVIPFLGNIVGAGTGIIAALLTLLLGGSIIVIAWFVYHPWLMALLALMVGGIIYWARARSKTRETYQPQWKTKTPPPSHPEADGI